MAPSRPSGAAKKEPAKKEGRQGRSRNRRHGLGRTRQNSELFAANQHCQNPVEAKSSGKTVDGWLPGGSMRLFLDEKRAQLQRQKMVSIGDLVSHQELAISPAQDR